MLRFVRSLLEIVVKPPAPSVSPLTNSAQIEGVTAPPVGVSPTTKKPAVKKPTVPSSTFK